MHENYSEKVMTPKISNVPRNCYKNLSSQLLFLYIYFFDTTTSEISNYIFLLSFI